jgi:hypothetical protein
MKLYGKEWTRRAIESRVGRIEQIGGIRRLQLTDGKESGVEEIQIRTGAGLSYSILPSRGLDIGLTEFGGVPLCWLSPNGEVHPSFFERQGTGWLRTAVGGLLMTCGLSQVGSPTMDAGEDLGLHGQAHHTPARQVCAEGYWEGDEYLTEIHGRVAETSIFGPTLSLTRRIRSQLGRNQIAIRDIVENTGFEPAPHMMLYHFNFGFPLLDTQTELHLLEEDVSRRGADRFRRDLGGWQAPQPGCRERVIYHEDLWPADDGIVTFTLRNPCFPLRNTPVTASLAWQSDNLPILVQWVMPGERTHVLGIEPANCHVEGRAAERGRGTLMMLEPGQTVEYNLEFSVREE